MSVKRTPKRSIRKRPFLLFEILAAIALVALCLVPLLRPHILMRGAKLRAMEEVQLETIAQTAFCDFKEMLFENKEHTWEELVTQAEGDLKRSYTLITALKQRREVRGHYKTWLIDHTTKQSPKKTAAVIRVELTFSPFKEPLPSFTRTLLLEEHA